MSSNGIQVGAWVKIEGECEIEYRVTGDEVEFSFGGRMNGFDILATERGLDRLLTAGNEALREMRSAAVKD
ncbi:hypothetical protein JOF56_005006 [Kibdelosporangium banguiense]|uniref:Uncharacterized protein n=1 Tax=Kibdelosporangium banguiense TaxID=1365924 RepID=A0ABS4TJT6_9PSEU|nr:hypothetical protein [Kibdelosporangium banguiense]MBP2324621.1 hypothetical protein [Kibdelosporangium banguiense]